MARCSLEEAFFDTSFFEVLQIPEYNEWRDLGNLTQISGLTDSYQSIIEIRVNNRKKRTILFKDFFNENVLFPLYQTQSFQLDFSDLNENHLTLVEKEIGTVAAYEFESNQFSLEKLLFSISILNVREMSFVILSKIEYDDTELFITKSDALVKERYAIL